MSTSVAVASYRKPTPAIEIVSQTSRESRKMPLLLIAATVFSCVFQLCWFWSKCIHQIDIDGIDYTRIALELRAGLFHSSINGFRSPLISWIIALLPIDVLRAGKLISVGSYLVSVALTYFLAQRLWHSKVVAGTAALLFSVSRGVAFEAVAMVTPDLLFTVFALLYFLVLIECLENDRRWLSLGAIHALAFLAKAFALPWLAVTTLIATLALTGPAKQKAKRVLSAAVVPIVFACLWGSILQSKYGVFTTGTQFKANLLQWTLKAYRNPRPSKYAVLKDVTTNTDQFMVGDPIPPGTWAWQYRLKLRAVLPEILKAEARNLPAMFKEFVILENPGILLAFSVFVAMAIRNRKWNQVEAVIALTIIGGAVSLFVAYSMLAVDSRYLFPLVPLVILFAARFLALASQHQYRSMRYVSLVITGVAVIASIAYRSSPFRVQTRDFQAICYRAAAILTQKSESIETVASVGAGPFPEHGVGWEAGYKTAYFAHNRLVATDEHMSSELSLSPLLEDLMKADPDAILVWDADGVKRRSLLAGLEPAYSNQAHIYDDKLGDVGIVLMRAKIASE
jgi:hypothetical protein